MTEAPRADIIAACKLADDYHQAWLSSPDNSPDAEITRAAEDAATTIVIETPARSLKELRAKALLLRRNLKWSNIEGQLSKYSEPRDYLALSIIDDIIALHGED